jgi:hypothetical protein
MLSVNVKLEETALSHLVEKEQIYFPPLKLYGGSPDSLLGLQGTKNKADIFVKYSPLLDPLQYLVGKYKKQHSFLYDSFAELVAGTAESGELEKLSSIHNFSYVDTFFVYLSSQLLEKHSFVHGVKFYSSSLGFCKNFVFDISDDIDWLKQFSYFLENKNLYSALDESSSLFLQNIHGIKRCKPLLLSDHSLNSTISIIDDIIDVKLEPAFYDTSAEPVIDIYSSLENIDSTNYIHMNEHDDDDDNSTYEHSEDDDDENSEYEHSGEDDDDEEDGDGDDEEDGDEDGDDDDDGEDGDDDEDGDENEEESCKIQIHNFPTQIIKMEKCDGTLDQLFEDNLLNEEEKISMLFQILMTLIMYQNVFQLTHNDLHTNNIMYVRTKQKYLYYEYKNQQYKVPTFGKIYKIIDFGRSIYTFENRVFFSDCFSCEGDAYSQYNDEPFYNDKKPRLSPNPSFDLCRLACSIYDFIFDEDHDFTTPPSPFQRLIYTFCLDDYGKNVLYKSNGEERYPNFKLYKMIARFVHRHIPENYLSDEAFASFFTTRASYPHIMKIPSKN